MATDSSRVRRRLAIKWHPHKCKDACASVVPPGESLDNCHDRFRATRRLASSGKSTRRSKRCRTGKRLGSTAILRTTGLVLEVHTPRLYPLSCSAPDDWEHLTAERNDRFTDLAEMMMSAYRAASTKRMSILSHRWLAGSSNL